MRETSHVLAQLARNISYSFYYCFPTAIDYKNMITTTTSTSSSAAAAAAAAAAATSHCPIGFVTIKPEHKTKKST